jgi:Glycine zipper
MNTLNLTSRLLAGLLVLGVAAASAQDQSQKTRPAAPPTSGKSLAASVGLNAYPAKGQSASVQTTDEAECYSWSKTQSGYDPMSPPPAAAPAQPAAAQQPAPTGARAKGAVRGAAAGAAVGEIANNDASEGAAVGAVVGVAAGGRQARKAQEQQKQQAAAQQQASADKAKADQQALADNFKRGMSACLESRGYTVK